MPQELQSDVEVPIATTRVACDGGGGRLVVGVAARRSRSGRVLEVALVRATECRSRPVACSARRRATLAPMEGAWKRRSPGLSMESVVLSLGILALQVDALFRGGDESDPTDTTGSLPMDEISEGSGCPCRVLDLRKICA